MKETVINEETVASAIEKLNEAREKVVPGIQPRKIHDMSRLKEIVDAMKRYSNAGMVIPFEWIEELEDVGLSVFMLDRK